MLTSKIKIVLGKDSLHRSTKGSITGIIYFDFGHYQFPEKEWSDFVVVIISWWLNALDQVVRGISKCIDFHFMDGPLLLRLKKDSKDILKLECIDEGKHAKVEFTSYVYLKNIFSELEIAAEELINQCKLNDWKSDDIEALKDEYKRMRARQLSNIK